MVAINAEQVWLAEFAPPNLTKLIRDLQNVYGVAAVGAKGDTNHLYGYHRSRNWILRSTYSAYGAGDYSVQSTLDKGGDGDWLCAFDLTPDSTQALIDICKRVDAAVRAGRLPQLREWFGNIDGDQVVDGFDALQQRAASSDSSHLWHLHGSLYRSRANDSHDGLFATITGTGATTTGDQDVILIVQKGTGATYTYNGVHRAYQGSPRVVASLQSIGTPTLAVDDVTEYGIEFDPREYYADRDAQRAHIAAGPSSGGGSGPGHDELVQAAFEGAQRAEQE